MGVVMITVFSMLATDHASASLFPDTTIAIGGSYERAPRWPGAPDLKYEAMPFLDINWRDRVELSSIDGLSIDLIGNDSWQGGIVGTMMWGRSQKDMRALYASLPTLINTLQGGLYLDRVITDGLLVGGRIRHDIQATGAAYAGIYGEWDLPAPGPIEHSLHAEVEYWNRSAQQRFFGIDAASASRLGSEAYKPGAGINAYSLSYQAMLPTSNSTALIFGASFKLLAGPSARSPLIRDHGERLQKSYMAAFVVSL